MPKTPRSGGSSGIENAERVRTLFYHFQNLPSTAQTSGRWNDMWAGRSSRYLDIQCDYIIGGGCQNNSSGWFRYNRILYGSTYNTLNTTSPHRPAGVALPSPGWRDLSTRLPAMSTLGITDAALGRSVFDIYTASTALYGPSGSAYELLLAWAGRGLNTSAGVGSSVRTA